MLRTTGPSEGTPELSPALLMTALIEVIRHGTSAQDKLGVFGDDIVARAPESAQQYIEANWREPDMTAGFHFINQLVGFAREGRPYRDEIEDHEMEGLGLHNPAAAMAIFQGLKTAWAGLVNVDAELHQHAQGQTIVLNLTLAFPLDDKDDHRQKPAVAATRHTYSQQFRTLLEEGYEGVAEDALP